MTLRSRGRLALFAGLVVALMGAWTGVTFAAFTSPQGSSGNTITAAPDWKGPTVSGGAGRASGPLGRIRQGDSVYLFLSVTDSGNPASGVASVTANVTVAGYGTISMPLTAGTYTVGGQTYNYRSAAQATPIPFAEQTLNIDVVATDNAGNSTNTNVPVVVDNTAPTATAIQTTNKAGGILGRPEQGDTITYSFSETMDPNSFIAGWDGTARSVTTRFTSAASDNVTIRNGAATVPLGTLNLNDTDFVNTTVDFANSTMTMTGNTITVVLGTTGTALTTGTGNNLMQWVPSNAATDVAGNGMSTTARNEVGTDRDF